MRQMIEELVSQTKILDIIGDTIRVRAPHVALGELAIVHNTDGTQSTARVIGLDGEIGSLQVFTGGKGLSTDAHVSFLGHAFRVTYSENLLGRIFRGSGDPMDGGPELN